MNSFFIKKFTLIGIILFLFFLFSVNTIYENEKTRIKDTIRNELKNNSLTIKSYFLTARSFIYSLECTIKDKLNIKDYTHPAFKTFRFNQKTNLLKIYNLGGLKTTILSSLSASGDPNGFNKQKIAEINAALHLKPIFNAAMKKLPDIKWIYYTSKNNFIYLSPNYNFKDDKNLLNQYNYAFWQEAIPRNNPFNRVIITDLYKDGIGKGLITTLSKPIYQEDEFKGIVSIDIGLNTLNDLLPKTNLKGKTYLIDEKKQIVASNEEFKLKKCIYCNDENSINIEVIEDELYIVHLVEKSILNKEALYNSSGKIFIIFLLVFITLIAIYLKELLTKVQYYANTDPLTNLLNRRSMQKEIEKLIEISKRYDQDLSFLLVDIDYFKNINDTYGHQTGDKVLVEVSRLFRNNTRNVDVVARFGGEEFLIALVNTNLDKAYILAERIRNGTNRIKIDTKDLDFTISIGCARLREKDTFYSILKRVDNLLYQAKENGRNRTVKEGEKI